VGDSVKGTNKNAGCEHPATLRQWPSVYTHFRPGGRLSVSQSPRFLSLIARTRAAVLGEPVQPQHEQEQARDASPATVSPVPLKVPRQFYRHEQTTPRVLAVMPSAATLRAAVPYLTPSAIKVHDLLIRLGHEVLRARGLEVLPSSLTLHSTAVGIALHLNLSERTIYRAADELTAAGILAHGGHAQNVRGLSRYDGTLWSISLKPGHTPRIRADEWRAVYRPDYAEEFYGKTGVRAEMSDLQDQKTGVAGFEILRNRAVVVVHAQNPRCASKSDTNAKHAVKGLEGAAERVRELGHAHYTKRAGAVTEAAQAIASSLNEPHRRAQWCKVLWHAFIHSNLEQVALNLLRLRTDLNEQAPWRRPGAVLMARLT
jgi:hypothetical protein